jgi:hypothetical protein
MDKLVIKKISDALVEYNENIEFELKTSKADEATKDLCLQIAKMTFYALDAIKDALEKA